MRLSKLRSGWFLFCCYWLGTARLILGSLFSRSPRYTCHVACQCCRRTLRGLQVAWLMVYRRRNADALVQLCQKVQTDRRRLYRNADAAFLLVQRLMAHQQYEKVIHLLNPLAENKPDRAKIFGVRGLAHLELGQYDQALADLTRCHELMPLVSMGFGFNYQRSFLLGRRGNVDAARLAMRDQLKLADDQPAHVELARFLHSRLKNLLSNLNLRGTTGVFIGAYHNAVGHAILDPFHYINLFAHRFDNLVMVHPDLSGYTAATRQTVSVLEQHVETVLCSDELVLNLAWQNLGELQHGNTTFLLYNYWALNRLAFKSRQESVHPLHQGRRYFQLPPKMVARAEALCRRNGLEIAEPLVVVHTREHGYHELRGQSYRNADSRNYIPALRNLVDLGYQVIRIGDCNMSSLRGEVPGMVELPMLDYYAPVLDPYIISRCRFMMSCQSGPCSYARAFGKPNLVLNAVYHYTLLPEYQELIAFKDYRQAATQQPLSVEQILEMGGHLFERTPHFIEKGIDVVDMTSAEIEAATREMLAWLDCPERAESPEQSQFRRLMLHFGKNRALSWPLATPATDYIGYALPECRISTAVAALRPGYLPVPSPAAKQAARSLVHAA